jgi:hypothetical protein
MKKNSFILYIILVSACGGTKLEKHTNDSSYKINMPQWLLGNWQDTSTQAHLYENWQLVNDSTYNAISCVTIKGDTVFNEKVVLQQRNNCLTYNVKVKKQASVSFVLVSNNTSKAQIFENKNNGFPQQIIYTHPTSDSLVASITGTDNGKFKQEFFKMIKLSSKY